MYTVHHDIGVSSGLLANIIEVLVRHVDPVRIIIFGSRARGDFGKVSDVDIAVERRQGSRLNRTVIEEEVRTLLKLDIVDLNEIDGGLRKEVEEQGIVVYEKD